MDAVGRSILRELLDKAPLVLQALPEGGAGWTTHQALFARGEGGLKPTSGKHIIPRQEHRALLEDFYRILKRSGWGPLCLGEDDLERDIAEDYLGTRMHWSHYDVETNLDMVRACGFEITWSRVVAGATSPGAAHLSVLAQKGGG